MQNTKVGRQSQLVDLDKETCVVRNHIACDLYVLVARIFIYFFSLHGPLALIIYGLIKQPACFIIFEGQDYCRKWF